MGLMGDSRASGSIHTKTPPQVCSALPPPHLLLYPTLGSGIFSHLTELCLSSPRTSQHHLAWSEYHVCCPELEVINPALKTEASQLVPAQGWNKMSLPCSTGVGFWDSSKCLHRAQASKMSPSAPNSRFPGFFHVTATSFPTMLPLSFLLERKIPQ